MTECKCVKRHNPEPKNIARHHILPKSWGGKDLPTNIIPICPTTHENIHTLLNLYVRHRGKPTKGELAKFNAFTQKYAAQAWRQRPSDKPPYTSQHGEITSPFISEMER